MVASGHGHHHPQPSRSEQNLDSEPNASGERERERERENDRGERNGPSTSRRTFGEGRRPVTKGEGRRRGEVRLIEIGGSDCDPATWILDSISNFSSRHRDRVESSKGKGPCLGNFSMASYYHNYDRFKTHTIMVEACNFCGEYFHPTYACPYHPRYGNHRSSSYASPQPNFYMSGPSPQIPQQERRTIEDIEKDMISDWLSPSTNKYPFDDWCNSSSQPDTYSSMQNQPSRDIIRFLLETEQDMNFTENTNQDHEYLLGNKIWILLGFFLKIVFEIFAAHEPQNPTAIPLESIEVNVLTPIEDYWSEPEEIIEVSLHEPSISIAQNETDEAEKEIDVILEMPEEPQKRSKEDQPLVLVTPSTLPYLPVKFTKGVVIKERSRIFYTADTFVSNDDDAIDSYVLEVPDELLHLKEGMYDELPKAIDAPFVVDISKREGIT
ncbi:hypothetical protein Sjap_003967 [Stephania japonica]|uniref:C2H2-type domain-containing protein n=1 Tax=Stephania japonica TaxID=461633 RepID=A0AAP0K261_9MAGN